MPGCRRIFRTLRSLLLPGIIGLLFILLVAEGAVADEESTRPNIVVFVADDAGWDDSTAYGNRRVRTPNIQRLADSGVTFTNAFVTSPQCSPSRASMLTGLYPHQTGAEDLHTPIPQEVRILPSYLRDGGYFTGSVLKQHIGRAAASQFDWYSPRLGRLEAFLDRAGERPFFLWVGFTDPHRPYYDGAIENPHDPEEVRVPAHLADTPQTRWEIARYYDEISRMDAWIGHYLDILEDWGLRENTVAIYLSDNGPPFPRAKGSLYDPGVRTPYIWSWPERIEPGTRRNDLTSTVDLAPTLLDVAGVRPPESMEGRSILAALTGPAGRDGQVDRGRELRGTGGGADPVTNDGTGGAARDAVFFQRNWHGTEDHIRAVRTRRYKLIINTYEEQPFGLPPDVAQSESWASLLRLQAEGELSRVQQLNFTTPRPPVEFYDLWRDAREYTNRAWDEAYAEEQARLFRELDAWMARTNDYPPGPEPRGDAVDRVTGRPREWRHRLLLWAERYVAPWLLPLVEREP